MSSKPTHRAYIVQEPKTEGGKARWIEIGKVWPHKNGNGFDLIIPKGLSVTGRIICIEPKDESSSD
ncbi:hypothetical protein [Accumulibacter sp.]|uniref:hypothetical protein n=1 Tax=Accumulibacter sp. TaxID=2053492 RepID=UPI00287A74E6|nr:hypothetical protein [Accumulibacter sp.]MDS4055362.1 hypothetical protein [Accumulibacter sp.]